MQNVRRISRNAWMPFLLFFFCFFVSLASAAPGVTEADPYPNLFSRFEEASTQLLKPYTNPYPDIVPARIENVTYRYTRDVVPISLVGMQQNPQTGLITLPSHILPRSLRLSGLQQGAIFVDETRRQAIRADIVNPEGTGFWSLGMPEYHEIFEVYEIPEQTQTLNIANVREVLIDPEPPTFGTGQRNNVPQSFGQELSFRFQNDSFNVEGVNVTIDGRITLSNLALSARYTGFSGYDFSLKAGEAIDLSITIAVELKRELFVPIVALDVDCPLATVQAGLFLIVNIDGSFQLLVAIDQEFSATVGVRGGTRFYVPTGFKPYKDFTKKFDFNTDFSGKINGSLNLAPLVRLRLLGKEVFYADVRAGIGLDVAALVEDGDKLLDIKIYGLVRSHVAVLGKGLDLFNERFFLGQSRKPDTGGYTFELYEACSYRSLVRGRVVTDKNQPYQGNIQIQRLNNGNHFDYTPFNATTNADGYFVRTGIALHKADEVRVLVLAGPQSPRSPSTLPFVGIDLKTVDFFQDRLVGRVPSGYDSTEAEVAYEGPVLIYTRRSNAANALGRAWHLLAEIPNHGNKGFLLDHDFKPDSEAYAYVNIRGHELYSPAVTADTGFMVYHSLSYSGLERSVHSTADASGMLTPIRVRYGEHLDLAIANTRGNKKLDAQGRIEADYGSSCAIPEFPTPCGILFDAHVGIKPRPADFFPGVDDQGNMVVGDRHAGESSARMTWRYAWDRPAAQVSVHGAKTSAIYPFEPVNPVLPVIPIYPVYPEPDILLTDNPGLHQSGAYYPRLFYCTPRTFSLVFDYEGVTIRIPFDSRGEGCQYQPHVDVIGLPPLEQLLSELRDSRWNPVVNPRDFVENSLDRIRIPAFITSDLTITLPDIQLGDQLLGAKIRLLHFPNPADREGFYWRLDNNLVAVRSGARQHASIVRGDTLQIRMSDLFYQGAPLGVEAILDYVGQLDGENHFWKLSALN